MPIAKLDGFCAQVTVTSRNLCLRVPGGASMCVTIPSVTAVDASELLEAMFAQVQSFLAPLTPVFNIIDTVIALFECVKAIPDAITNLDPTGLIECIPNLAEAINKLIQLIPILSIPAFIVDLLDVIIFFLTTLSSQLAAMNARLNQIIQANTEAAAPGNVALLLAMDCINGNFDADLASLNARLGPLNRLLGLVDFLLELSGLKGLLKQAGVDVTPCLGNLDLQFGEELIDLLVKILTIIRNLIPLPSFAFDITGAPDTSVCG